MPKNARHWNVESVSVRRGMEHEGCWTFREIVAVYVVLISRVFCHFLFCVCMEKCSITFRLDTICGYYYDMHYTYEAQTLRPDFQRRRKANLPLSTTVILLYNDTCHCRRSRPILVLMRFKAAEAFRRLDATYLRESDCVVYSRRNSCSLDKSLRISTSVFWDSSTFDTCAMRSYRSLRLLLLSLSHLKARAFPHNHLQYAYASLASRITYQLYPVYST